MDISSQPWASMSCYQLPKGSVVSTGIIGQHILHWCDADTVVMAPNVNPHLQWCKRCGFFRWTASTG